MPFRSEKQRKYLWKNHPKIAKDWTDTYGSKPVKKQSGGTMTTEETFKKMVPFSPWTSPKFKWKKWLLAPYKNAQGVDNMVKRIKAGECPPGTKPVGKNKGWKTLCRVKKKEGGLTPNDAIPKKAKGGSMDPYYGSYIKGRVDGKTLSNPSYRKYYKGLI